MTITPHMKAVLLFLWWTKVDENFWSVSGSCWNSSAITKTDVADKTIVAMVRHTMTTVDLEKRQERRVVYRNALVLIEDSRTRTEIGYVVLGGKTTKYLSRRKGIILR